MRLAAVSFLVGTLLLHACPQLPPAWCLSAVLPALLLLIGRWTRPAGWLLLGFLWTLAWALPLTQNPLPADLEKTDLHVTGWIASIPEHQQHRRRFQFAIQHLSHAGHTIHLPGRLLLSWYGSPPQALQVGDRWRLTVRLQRPRGFRNPGGFDYERWLFLHRIAATGYVRSKPAAVRLGGAERFPLTRWRQHLAQRLHQLLAGNRYGGILTAIAVGDRQGIDSDQWQLLRHTGTSHLMAISGLHIGLVAGLIYWLILGLWSLWPMAALRWPAPKAAAAGALLAAGGYALLAGLALPTQRALIMLAVALLALLRQRPVVPSRLLAAALLAVLLIDPGAPLAAGFWLSFSAVGALLYAISGHYPRRSAWYHWPRLQLVVLLALAPITLLNFQRITLVSPLANLLAIPWASLLIVPQTLLGVLALAISSSLAGALLALASAATDLLWRLLHLLAQWHTSQLVLPAPPLWTFIFVVPGLMLLLAPRGIPGRWLGLPLCLPLVFFPSGRPAPGSALFTLLDTGSGLASVVQTAHHTLVYDTGRWFSGNFDAGRFALVPFLHQAASPRVDVLIISDPGNRYRGGVRSLRAALPVARTLVPDSRALPINGAERCQNRHWRWDGVRFRLFATGPASSCVLLVTAAGHRLLLTGNPSADTVRALFPALTSRAPIDVLLAPQQGRRPPPQGLLESARPRYVLLATGYHNRWGYPRPATLRRYRASGAILLDTATSGAISFRLSTRQTLRPRHYRQAMRHYWNALKN